MDDQNHHHDQDVCLGLGLGSSTTGFTPKRENSRKINNRLFFLDLSIPIGPTGIESSPSFNTLKKGDERRSKEDVEDNNECSRKKLRLTRDQTTLLEDSFRQHTTLNTAQKQALAEELNLKPRQVEVWFQNRRARTKLKQTEVECEYLKKNCDRLTEENRRLKKELSEIRSLMNPAAYHHPPHHHQCRKSAEKNRGGGGGGERREAAAAAAVEGGPSSINPN